MLRSGLWFVPACFALGAVVLWLVLGAVDRTISTAPSVGFGGGPDGAQEALSAIASSMITFTAVVFSVTIVTLQLASGQFSPRVLRSFLRDRRTQAALGSFIATFLYALLVLRDVRIAGPGQEAYVPRLSITAAFVVLASSLVMFVIFINHIAQSIRASRITGAVGDETRRVIDRLVPEGGDVVADDRAGARPTGVPHRVGASRPGVAVAFDHERLVALARDADSVLMTNIRPGDFVPTGAILLDTYGSTRLDEKAEKAARAAVTLGPERTMHQDIEFGFRQLVDVAVRALSPGVNDPTTAIQCLDQLHDLLRRLASRPFPDGVHRDGIGHARFIEPRYEWDRFLDLALDEIREAGVSMVRVPPRIAALLTDVWTVALPDRRGALEDHIARLGASMDGPHPAPLRDHG